VRETELYPRTFQLGVMQGTRDRPTFRPVARNLRFFSKTPYARRAINAIKDVKNKEFRDFGRKLDQKGGALSLV
jgi:hypothetical protein